MRYVRTLMMALAVGAVMLAPVAVFAADTSPLQEGWTLYPDQCKCEGRAPDFKCVGAVVQNLVNLAIAVGVVIFVLVAAYAGVLFMASSVNPKGKEQAKSMLTTALIGFVTMLAAWLIVDFIMKALYNEKWGPWNSILSNPDAEYCLQQNTSAPGSIGGGIRGETGTGGTGQTPEFDFTVGQPVECRIGSGYVPGSVTILGPSANRITVAFEGTMEDGSAIGTFQVLESDCRARGGTTDPDEPEGPAAGTFPLSSNIDSRQRGDAATQLSSLLSCMASKPGTAGAVITSISDDCLYRSVSGECSAVKTWAQCRAGECQHGQNSWHYGGANGSDRSLAVDFGNNSNSAALRGVLEDAACECNSNVRLLQEGGGSIGNSLHISFGNSEGRECN